MAAQLMAGIDGICREMDPTELGFGPIDADVFAWTEEQRSSIKPLPASLSEALQALEQDHDFLLAGDVFSLELDVWHSIHFLTARSLPTILCETIRLSITSVWHSMHLTCRK